MTDWNTKPTFTRRNLVSSSALWPEMSSPPTTMVPSCRHDRCEGRADLDDHAHFDCARMAPVDDAMSPSSSPAEEHQRDGDSVRITAAVENVMIIKNRPVAAGAKPSVGITPSTFGSGVPASGFTLTTASSSMVAGDPWLRTGRDHGKLRT